MRRVIPLLALGLVACVSEPAVVPEEVVDIASLDRRSVRHIEEGTFAFSLFTPAPEHMVSRAETLDVFILCDACGALKIDVKVLSFVQTRLEPEPRATRRIEPSVDRSAYRVLGEDESVACGSWNLESRTILAVPVTPPPACPDCGGPVRLPSRAEARGSDRPIAWYTSWIDEPPASPEGLNDRGWALARRREWTRAVADLERSLALFPDQPHEENVREFLARCREQAGR